MILKDKKVSTIRFLFILFSLLITNSILAWARPLFTEEAATRGYLNFEAGASISERIDEFKTPDTRYETVLLPVRFRLGLHDRLDLGITLRHISQRLKTENTRLSGSQNAQFSPEFKWRFFDTTSFQFVWHFARGENRETLPFARGEDYEFLLAYDTRTFWPIHLNAGYTFRGKYNSNFGVIGTPDSRIDPGNVFETKGSFEIPLFYQLYFLSELIYNNTATREINSASVADSSGEALDIATGITWQWKEWYIGTAIAFGLLDEQHTSFGIDRGAGDFMLKFSLSYKLLRSKFRK